MKRSERFDGSRDPFEGDRLLTLQCVPEGARVTAATLTLTPVAPPGRNLFEEVISLSGEPGTWGATVAHGGTAPQWAEVDFHNRRTLAQFEGSNLTNANLQLDLGGVYVEINSQGAVRAPGDTLFAIPTDGVVPGLTANKVKLTRAAGAITLTRVRVSSTPSNLTARLGAAPPFYARPGELAQADTTPDFAVAFQAALDASEVAGGFHLVPLVVHSDTIARLDVEFRVEFVLEQTALPGGLGESTITYDHATTPKVGSAPLVVAVPAGARVVESNARPRAVGAFDQSHVVYGPTGELTPIGVLPIAPTQPLARPITAAADLAITSVDLLLGVVSRSATINVDFVDDTDGKPWNEPKLSRPMVINLDRDVLQGASWINVELPEELQLLAGRRYWLTVQSISGDATWSAAATSESPGTQRSADGGLSWRDAQIGNVVSTAGLVRLRHVPNRFTMPIELQVGDTAAAERVSLARFEPLGRVEIDLDAEEIREAINRQVAAVADRATCRTGEQVRNGDFAEWLRTADLPNLPARPILPGHPVSQVAVSSDNCVAYAAGFDDRGLHVSALDVFADRGEATLDLEADEPLVGLVVDPDGTRAYVLTGEGTEAHVFVVPGVGNDEDWFEVAAPDATAIALSPDGTTLYVAFGGSVEGAGSRVSTFTASALHAAIPPSAEGSLDLADAGVPRGLAPNPDGSLLYVVMEDGDTSASVLVVDVTRMALAGDRADMPIAPRAPVISGDGTTLLTVHGPGRLLSVTNLTNLTVTTVALDGVPTAAAVSPDARYGFVAVAAAAGAAPAGAGTTVVVDLGTLRIVRRIPVSASPSGVTLTPEGERLFVADPAAATGGAPVLTVFPIGTLVPEEWLVTAGHVRPVCLAPLGRIALLDASKHPEDARATTTAVAQVVPVGGGCPYELTFLGRASTDAASAEIHWLGAACDPMRVDVVPIEGFDPTNKAGTDRVGLVAHRATLQAPAGAAQAEIRFVALAGTRAGIDRVSFGASDDLLANGRLAPAGDGALAGWTIRPASAPGISAVETGSGIRIGNAGSAAVTIAQTVAVDAGGVYELTLVASSTRRDAPRPSVEIAFLSPAGEPLGSPVPRDITATGSDRATMRVTVPASGVETAEIRLVVPGSVTVDVDALSFRARPTVEIPLTFIAQSPGELTVSDWRVSFDADEQPRPAPVPAGGLCTPRKPEPLPGEEDDDCSYCASCEGEHELRGPQPATTGTGRPAVATTCSNCGSRVVVPGRVVARPPGAVATPLRVRRVQVGDPATIGARVLDLPRVAIARPAVPGLIAINGVGERMAARLDGIGIGDLDGLATAGVERISALRGVSPAMAEDWIGQARRLRRHDG